VRATSTNRHLNAVLAKFRATYALNKPIPIGPLRELDSRRNEAVGEFRAIFDALSPLMLTPQ
jgi:hypothetical protein